MMKTILSAALLAAGLMAGSAQAGVLYSDGSINGTVDALTINYGFQVADTFNLSGGSTLTSVQGVGLWLFPGDTATSVQWSILTSNGGLLGTTVASGTASLSLSSAGADSYGFSLYNAAFSLPNLKLGAGTYWLELQNLNVASGDSGYWDINGGPSNSWENTIGYMGSNNCGTSGWGNGVFEDCSSPFQIVGNVAVPEPATVSLVGVGLAAVGGWRLRRKAKSA